MRQPSATIARERAHDSQPSNLIAGYEGQAGHIDGDAERYDQQSALFEAPAQVPLNQCTRYHIGTPPSRMTEQTVF